MTRSGRSIRPNERSRSAYALAGVGANGVTPYVPLGSVSGSRDVPLEPTGEADAPRMRIRELLGGRMSLHASVQNAGERGARAYGKPNLEALHVPVAEIESRPVSSMSVAGDFTETSNAAAVGRVHRERHVSHGSPSHPPRGVAYPISRSARAMANHEAAAKAWHEYAKAHALAAREYHEAARGHKLAAKAFQGWRSRWTNPKQSGKK
jgi:hypothetical protein